MSSCRICLFPSSLAFCTGHGIAASIHKLLLLKQQGTFGTDCSRLKGCLWALLYERFLYIHGADGGLCTGSLPWPGEYQTTPNLFHGYMIPVLQLRERGCDRLLSTTVVNQTAGPTSRMAGTCTSARCVRSPLVSPRRPGHGFNAVCGVMRV